MHLAHLHGAHPAHPAHPAGAPEAGESDRMYSINDTSPSSLMSPWNVGINGWNPRTTLACEFRIDSRT
jgi:hypothetical protein